MRLWSIWLEPKDLGATNARKKQLGSFWWNKPLQGLVPYCISVELCTTGLEGAWISWESRSWYETSIMNWVCPESFISDPDLMWPASLGLQTGFEREFQTYKPTTLRFKLTSRKISKGKLELGRSKESRGMMMLLLKELVTKKKDEE